MREEKLSVRQLSVAALTGALAPAVAGAGYGWQGALLAVPVLLLAEAPWSAWPPAGGRWGQALWGTCLPSCTPHGELSSWPGGWGGCAGRILHTGGGDQAHFPWLVLLLALPLAWGGLGESLRLFSGERSSAIWLR